MNPSEFKLLIEVALAVREMAPPDRIRSIDRVMNALEQDRDDFSASDYPLVRALERIADMPVRDQPATSSVDECVWLMQHISQIRRVALEALAEKNKRTSASERQRLDAS